MAYTASQILIDQVTAYLTEQLGRAPTAAEILNGLVAPWVLGNVHNELTVGSAALTIDSTGDMQASIDLLSANGGGTLILIPGTYNLSADVVIPTGINIQGSGGGTDIDFGGTASGFIIHGSDPYSTGTIDVTLGSDTITGSGTTWTEAMAGQSILAGDYWYEIVTRVSDTEITIDRSYAGTTDSGIPYVIATTVDDVTVKGITASNSTSSIFSVLYSNNLTLDSVIVSDGDIGFDGTDSSFVFLLNCTFDACTTAGLQFFNHHYGMYINSGAIGNIGYGFLADTIRNWTVVAVSIESGGDTGMSLANCANMGVENVSMRNNTGSGLEVGTGCLALTISNGSFAYNGADGITVSGDATRTIMSVSDFPNNGAYGVSVGALATDTLISVNTFDSNSSGAVDDNGTGTLIRSNIGVADN